MTNITQKDHILRCLNVSARQGQQAVLKNISIDFTAGIHSILGPNGAGKSSLIKALAGDIPLDTGSIQFLNKDIKAWKQADLAQNFAVLPQKSNLNFAFSVREVVELGRIPHSSGYQCDQEIIKTCIQALDLNKLSHKAYTQLSGGEQQRCQLARTLCQIWPQPTNITTASPKPTSQAKVLLLDEPSSALDIKHQYALMRLLQDLAKHGVCIICVMHDFNLASQFSDNISLLKNGELVLSGHTETCLIADVFSDVFDCKVIESKHPGTNKKGLSFYA
ncbi:heme ABC transporter ATP-binding protein [Agaribacterium sp. ZY112]|uniref:heme ABC transporter ATP-binding protein n=1 Tax=Agaribacterium sp. ZY112 TaxID=3233574 RepID=UPI003523D980